jgi:hypothetical protein
MKKACRAAGFDCLFRRNVRRSDCFVSVRKRNLLHDKFHAPVFGAAHFVGVTGDGCQ